MVNRATSFKNLRRCSDDRASGAPGGRTAVERRILRLFEAAGPTRPGGKPQRYLGAYAIDPQAPYRYEPAPDRNGSIRNVIVFRLLAAGPSVETASKVFVNAPTNPTTVELVPVEVNSVERFQVAATDKREGQRWEASIMRQLERYHEGLDHTVRRVEIRPAGESTRLLTDTTTPRQANSLRLSGLYHLKGVPVTVCVVATVAVGGSLGVSVSG